MKFLTLLKPVIIIILGLSLSGCAGAVVGGTAAVIVADRSEKGFSKTVSDLGIKVEIQKSYLQTSISLLSKVTIAVNDGAVVLTGNVKQAEHKIEASRLAWDVRGVTEVINELKVNDQSSLKDIAKDLAAAAQFRTSIIADGDISSLNFSADIVNGTVYLTGLAASEEEMNKVVEHARKLRFAKDVVNYIRVNDDDR